MKALLALTLVTLLTFVAASNNEVEQGPLRCATCQFVIKEAEKVIQSNMTQAAIEKILNQICAKVEMQAFCSTLVIPYVKQIIQSLIEKVNPIEICQKLKLCDTNTTTATVKAVSAALEERSVVEAEAEAGVRCSVCVAVVKYVINNLSGPANEQKVQELVAHACQKLPFAKNVCAHYIAPLVAQLTNAIAQGLDPNEVCQSVHLCQ